MDARGTLMVVVENRAPFAVTGILLTPVLLDNNGRIEQQGRQLRITQRLQPGERAAVNAGVGATTDDIRRRVRVRVDAAAAAK